MADSIKVVKTLQFSNDSQQYQINAVKLEGHTWTEIDQRFSTIESFDALRYMGTIAAGATLPAADKGDVYKVTSKGTIAGAKVEIGDMLICNTDKTAANTAANWDIIQGNVDADALLDHYHTANVSLTKTDKTLSHEVTPTKKDITAAFSGGSATVTGNHGHTASGSVTLTPAGSLSETSITPEGTVKLTTPTTKGTNDAEITPAGTVGAADKKYVTTVATADHEAHTHTVNGGVTISVGTTGTVNYTPAGTLNDATTVTEVTAGDTTVSAHVASSENAGGFTPAGTVTVENASAGVTIDKHKHTVVLNPTSETYSGVTSVTGSAAGTGDDLVLTINVGTGSITALTGVSVSSVSEETLEATAIPHNHTASFAGTAVAAHNHKINVEDHAKFIPVIDVTKSAHKHTFTGTGARLVATHDLSTAANTKGLTHTDASTYETAGHTHSFTGTTKYLSAAFTGTARSHKHDFTGTENTHAVTVNVNDFSGNFTGSASGNVNLTNATGVVTDVSVTAHKIATVDSASVTTGKAIQD